MSVEIRILSGSLAGRVKHFEQSVVVVGRHGGCDLRFDPEKDIDVSSRHAEIRLTSGRYFVHDNNSTNGTFVNDKKMDAGASVELKHGDKITFGAGGPETEIRLPDGIAANAKTPSTEVRVAMAVKEQTAGLKRMMIATLLLIVVGGGGALYYAKHQSSQRVEELNKILAANDSMRIQLQSGMARSGDTTLANDINRRMAELRRRLAAASSGDERGRIQREIEEAERQLRRMVSMDLPTIFTRNSGAVAILIAEIAGQPAAGTAFAITKDGLLVTNRHNVRDSLGRLPTRIAVKFTNTRDWLPAHVVKVSDHPDEDLALIQMDRGSPFPVVEGVSANAADASEGMSVATIGYPLGYDTPMEGEGNDFMAKSTLNPGTVSKKTSSVLQIDSYATHGSSGSPVFSRRGLVVGIVYGGQRDAGGKIVYAVPPERIAAFIPEKHKSVVRD